MKAKKGEERMVLRVTESAVSFGEGFKLEVLPQDADKMMGTRWGRDGDEMGTRWGRDQRDPRRDLSEM